MVLFKEGDRIRIPTGEEFKKAGWKVTQFDASTNNLSSLVLSKFFGQIVTIMEGTGNSIRLGDSACAVNAEELSHALKYRNALPKEARRKKVSKIGTISIGIEYANTHIIVQDNEDGTLTIILGVGRG